MAQLKKVWLIVVGLLVLSLAVVLGRRVQAPAAPSAASEAPASDHARQRPTPSVGGSAVPKTPKPKSPEPGLGDARRRRADEIRRALQALYGSSSEPKPSGSGAVLAPPSMPGPRGSGNQAQQAQGDYIKRVVTEQFHPVAGSCYEELLGRDPAAEGDVVLDFSIAGNEQLGGVVESVEVHDEGTTLLDEQFLVCVRESMYTTTFEAPPSGTHSITVSYPFSFAP